MNTYEQIYTTYKLFNNKILVINVTKFEFGKLRLIPLQISLYFFNAYLVAPETTKRERR